MALHQLRSLVMGVPDPAPCAQYYSDFGLTADPDLGFSTTDGGRQRSEWGFSTTDGGRQLLIRQAPTRRLLEMVVSVDDEDDLERAASALAGAGYRYTRGTTSLEAVELETQVKVVLQVTGRAQANQGGPLANPTNSSGGQARGPGRCDATQRSGPVRPRRLGHVVVTTTNLPATSSFFSKLGFKVSDYIGEVGVFMRCSTDHHNLLVLSAPVVYLHHTAWQVDDVDEIGRGATTLIEDHPERHVWGLGRHHAGSNFFWYLRDPAGNFSEYYADLDYIPEDAMWVPESHSGRFGLYSWGPPPPASFLQPDDLMELASKRRAVGA